MQRITTCGWCGWWMLACLLGACGKRGDQAREDVGMAGFEMTAEGFHRAAAADQTEVLRSFVKGGMAVATTDADGNSALHAAAASGAEKAAEYLLDKGLAIDVTGAGGRTPLLVAAAAGQAGMVRQLLRQGADPAKCDAEGYRPLQRAVREGHAAAVAELAPHDRGDLDAVLLMAALLGKAQVIDVLTRYGASVYARMDDGRTALMVAAENGHADAVKMLLETGANRFALDEQGRTAVDLATTGGHPAIVAMIEDTAAAGDFGIEEPGELGEQMLAFLDQQEPGTAVEVVPVPGSADDKPVLVSPNVGPLPGGSSDTPRASKALASLDGATVAVMAKNPPGKASGASIPVAGRPPVTSGGTSAAPAADAAALPALVMRHYRESELPVRLKAVTAGRVRVELLSGPRREVELSQGQLLPGSRLRVVRVESRTQSSKLNDGRPEDVSVVEVEDTRGGGRRQWVVGTPASAHEPVAIMQDAVSGQRYLAMPGASFQTRDGTRYTVEDVRANQVVMENNATGETVTLPMRGPKG